MASWPLTDKVVLVIGGARGIGAATAAELARRGARPVLADVDAEQLERTAATLQPAPLRLELDVTDPQACEAAVAEVLEQHGRLDIAWANAGIASGGPLWLADPAAWRRTIEVNLLGSYNTLRAAVPALIETRGYAAATASLASFAHAMQMSAYCASKAGLEAMCDSLRLELAHTGVDVGSIHPTWIDTEMVREGDEWNAFRLMRDSLRGPFKRTYPVQRAAAEIADGFERRARRICVPRFVALAHWLRPLLATRAFERDQRAIAARTLDAFEQDLERRGPARASVSDRVARQL